ncbi:transcriptional regulator with XRE-family HTH domain/tetratricopeptide (TPR) repeat protein [Streptosporangium album]|uniref:Transcriptional regulator with XRE-family HTH domain/tetratricopeptide (TPR) repeat protein n=1 Tax=Streptosporangium album TaxID=47479 RepID=A0A7W7S0V8_9ACTN|nr:helix-turn-helix domain-containing protein [Streptosporangium album]MBB4941826.1 transcriptional regulator with XRE-family HTH domain/tetratricopeptide (TPR) repeat protein [Streptosporangium album]
MARKLGAASTRGAEKERSIITPTSFAESLRQYRHAARLTLEQLAEASGVSARTLSDMERGRSTGPQHRTVTALAQALSLGEDDRKQFIDLARDGRLRDHWTRPTGLCELPRSVDDFTGRATELAWTDDFVRAGDAPGAAGVALITGAAGLGKTTFAVRAAHVLRPSFPDGVLFVDLFGMSPRPLTVDDALMHLLRALGTADRLMPHDLLERASLYRSLLRQRRVLVVLDNAGSEEQIRPILPGGGPSRALVTSRRLLAGLEGVHRLSLGPLPPVEAAELLTGIVAKRGSSDGGAAISELAQFCSGLPLALRIVGNRLVSRPAWPAAEFADRLADKERRLDQLRAGDLKVATAFGMSYEQLAVLARRVFRRLSLVPGRDFDADLADLSSPEEAGHWLRVNVDNWLGALRTAASGGRHSAVLDCAESMYWFSDRWMHAPHWHEVFTLGAEAAAALGDPARQATQLNSLAWVHLVPRDDPETTLRYTAQAMDLATRSGATAQIAWAHHNTGGALRRLGRLDEATASETQAAEMFKANGDIDAYCQCLGALGTCLRDAGHYAEALEQYLDLWALLNDDRSGMTPSIAAFTRPIALARVGECLGLLGHRTEAIIKLTEAISLMEQAQLPVPQARSLETLAALLADEGRTGESRQAYARAAEVFEAIGDTEAAGRCRDLATAPH